MAHAGCDFPETTLIDAQHENRWPISETLRVEEQRLALLCWLWATPTYTANEELAGLYLKAVGLAAAYADVRARLDDLERMNLLTARIEGTLKVITLTRRGADAAEGVIFVKGVRRPGPQCPYWALTLSRPA
jgi:hypothetical protein